MSNHFHTLKAADIPDSALKVDILVFTSTIIFAWLEQSQQCSSMGMITHLQPLLRRKRSWNFD